MGPDVEQASLRPSVAFFRTFAERNHLRSRRRFLRVRRLTSQDDNVEVWEDYVHTAEPSDHESIPAASQATPLNLPTYFSLPLSSLDPRLTAQSAKRPGETLESGSTKEPSAERVKPQQDEGAGPKTDPPSQAVNMEDYQRGADPNTHSSGLWIWRITVSFPQMMITCD